MMTDGDSTVRLFQYVSMILERLLRASLHVDFVV